jgi:hypothetical protein
MSHPKVSNRSGAAPSHKTDDMFNRQVGAVVGDPDCERYATGRPNTNVKAMGREMVRARHEGSDAFLDAED